MKNTKQAIALASAAALSVGMLAGCGGDIDGALVGGASLKAEDFYAICAAAQI